MNIAGTYSYQQNVANEHESQQSLDEIYITLAQNSADITSLEISQLAQDGQISTLSGRATALETSDGLQNTAIFDVSGRVQTLETSQGVQNGQITDVSGRVQTLETSQGVQNGQITDVSGRVQTLETSQGVQNGQITDVSGRVQTLETSQGVQNGQITDVSGRVQTLETSQGVQDGQISGLSTRMTTAETNITAVEGVNTTQNSRLTTAETNITTVLSRTTGQSYYGPTDTTYFFNRVYISSPIDGTTSTPQLILIDDSPTDGNINLSIMCGANLGNWNNLVQNNDGLFLLRKNDTSQSYTGGMVFTTHGGTGGFRFSYNPAVPSVFRSNINLEANNLFTTGNLSGGSITLAGTNLATTLTSLQTQISNMTICQGYYVDQGTPSTGVPGHLTNYTVINPDYFTGANLVTISSDHLIFNTAGLYRINFAWTHVSDQGNNGGVTFFTMMTGAFGTTDPQPSPFLNDLLEHSFTGVANTDDGFQIVATTLYPMQLDENSSYRYEYYVKNRTADTVRPNRWNLSYFAEMGAGQKLYFKMRANFAWSTDHHRFIIQKMV